MEFFFCPTPLRCNPKHLAPKPDLPMPRLLAPCPLKIPFVVAAKCQREQHGSYNIISHLICVRLPVVANNTPDDDGDGVEGEL